MRSLLSYLRSRWGIRQIEVATWLPLETFEEVWGWLYYSLSTIRCKSYIYWIPQGELVHIEAPYAIVIDSSMRTFVCAWCWNIRENTDTVPPPKSNRQFVRYIGTTIWRQSRSYWTHEGWRWGIGWYRLWRLWIEVSLILDLLRALRYNVLLLWRM